MWHKQGCQRGCHRGCQHTKPNFTYNRQCIWTENNKWHHQLPTCCCIHPIKRPVDTSNQEGHYITWQLLTTKATNKYYQNTMATALGHLDRKRKTYNHPKQKKKPTLIQHHSKRINQTTFSLRFLQQQMKVLCTPIWLKNFQSLQYARTSTSLSFITTIPIAYW